MSDFNVMDMAKIIAGSQDTTVDGLFMKKEDNDQSASISTKQNVEVAATPQSTVAKKGEWVPDASAIADMPELSGGPVTYAPDEIKVDDNEPLRNLADDDAIESAGDQKNEMERINSNVEAAKARYGIIKLQVPPGSHQVRMITAASDSDPEIAANKLNQIMEEIIQVYPEFILERDPAFQQSELSTDNQVNNKPGDISDNNESQHDNANDEEPAAQIVQMPSTDDKQSDDLKVVIDKSNLPDVSWSDDEMNKIRKARTVELNIIEGKPLEFSEIKKPSNGNVVGSVISKYIRKKSDVTASLPASKYRCTFTGLSYPEVLDLTNSVDLSTVDAEMKKWTLCFNHMRNMSIGEWNQYQWYLDPNTMERVIIYPGTDIPDSIDREQIRFHSRFDDFMEKTSFMDLNFMLWKILCATCMDTEIIQIDCHAKKSNGSQCTNHYDWIYSPSELIEMDSIQEAVLEEMEKTGTVSGVDAVMENYNESFLVKDRTVKLPDSGIYAVFGHISARKYMDEICPIIKDLEKQTEDAIKLHIDPDPDIATKGLNYTTLTIIKEFVVETDDGMVSITDTDEMLEIISSMSELDWLSIGKIVQIVMEPYDFKYSMRGLVCPKCRNRSKINIDNISTLLFIVAQSLSSVQVEFKTT